jgi:hypothetical protein
MARLVVVALTALAVDAGGTSMSDTTAEEVRADEERPEAREIIESAQDRLIDSVTASQQEAIDSVESARNAMVDGLGLAQRALADFVTERLRQDLATQRALLASRSLDEARAIGFAHLRTTVDQYGRGMSGMVRLGTAVARRSLERPRFAIRG